MRPEHSIALLQLEEPTTTQIELIYPCRYSEDHGTRLGTVGMGSTSGKSPLYPHSIWEAHFLESKLSEPISPFRLDRLKKCPDSLVCTNRVSAGANICHKDIGGPLYTFKCGTNIPQCLYGVATQFKKKSYRSDDDCDGGSLFTSVPHFYRWIRHTMFSYGRYQFID